MSKRETNREALVIYAHPYDGSFAHAELDMAISALKKRGKKYKVIDLYKDKFDPVFHGRELAQYARGVTDVPQVLKYQKMLHGADELIIIYPIWWGGRPAILQGFFDKVFLSGNTWEGKVMPVVKIPFLWGKCTWIKRVNVFTTGVTPGLAVRFYLGNPQKRGMMSGTIGALNMKGKHYQYTDRISSRSDKNRAKVLKKVYKKVAKPGTWKEESFKPFKKDWLLKKDA